MSTLVQTEAQCAYLFHAPALSESLRLLTMAELKLMAYRRRHLLKPWKHSESIICLDLGL
jgi:hypothetical protein